MCGILAALGVAGDQKAARVKVLRASKLQRHRGPDATSVYAGPNGCFIVFERLNIVDVTEKGMQPFTIDTPEGRIAWALNSEIYNHEDVRAKQLEGVEIPTTSDSAIVGHMYHKDGNSDALWNALDGIFACVIVDERTGTFVAARDPLGICSFYWGRGRDGSLWFASELKSLQENCDVIQFFPPGHRVSGRISDIPQLQSGELPETQRWFQPAWLDVDRIPSQPLDFAVVRDTFISSVVKRLMSDAPLGVLLSGGLDSSLVASVAVKHLQEAKNAYDTRHKLHTFSVGLPGSPDLKAARQVADYLGTIHHEFTFTVQEGLDALEDLIWHIESFEQVRAAVPMYVLTRKIKAMGIKVVLSGEGADEALGGYLFFHSAPSAAEYHKETVRLVRRLHQWDVLRANKAPFAWGVETRVPFLDKGFLDLVMNIDPQEKMISPEAKREERASRSHLDHCCEKWLLRKAFDPTTLPRGEKDRYLPDAVLWRQKEQFSDGVGYSWVDGLKEYAEQVVTEEQWAARAERFPGDPPKTKEYYLLREIFQRQFPSQAAYDTVPRGMSIACSTEHAIAWDPSFAGSHEISGRAMKDVHEGNAHLADEVRPDGLHNGTTAVAAAADLSAANGFSGGFSRAAVDAKPGRIPDDGGLNNLSRVSFDGSLKEPETPAGMAN